MSKILVIAGAKQSGKSSLANFLYGFYLTKNKVIKEFTIDEDGDLIVPSFVVDETGKETFGVGMLNIQNPSEKVAIWAANNVWPIIKDYAFANSLKLTCMELFGLTESQCFGTNEEKDSKTNIRWKDMCKLLTVQEINKIKKDGRYEELMSSRELLQYFGTNICRTLYDDIWIDKVFNQINRENPKLAVITDCRFENEIHKCKEKGAIIVKLTKKEYEDGHSSETSLDNVSDSLFDFVIDNKNMTIKEKNYAIYDCLNKLGWINL